MCLELSQVAQGGAMLCESARKLVGRRIVGVREKGEDLEMLLDNEDKLLVTQESAKGLDLSPGEEPALKLNNETVWRRDIG